MYKKYTNNVYGPPGLYKKFLRIMKITTLILFAALMQVSAAGLAQRLTLPKQDITLKQFFNEINQQTNYTVVWSATQVNGDQKITVDFKDSPLLEALDKSLQNTNLTYTIEDKTVVIKQKEPSFLDKIKTALNLPVTISGKVQDGTGQPIPGVNVREKGTQNGTITDAKGLYSITVADTKSVITFSYIGYETQELAAKDIPAGSTITLKTAENNLHEVVVNKGYYSEKQELSTGDVFIVTAKEIEEQPVTDPILALEGRVPGLQVSQSSGIPGAYSTIQLRGQNNFVAGATGGPLTANDPLYVIDGVPYSSASLSSPYIGGGAVGTPGAAYPGFPVGGLSPFNSLNPADIEDIQVLKDADATAIYGSRGANGVILITTKKGKAGDTKVDVNISQGIGQVTRQLPLMNTQQYLEMRHEAFKNDGLSPGPTDFDVNGVWDTTRYTNWQKLLIGGTAHYTNAQGSISGGTANTQFYIGGGYSRQTTVFPGDYEDDKGSLRVSLTHTSSNQKFHAQFSAGYVNDNSDIPNVDLTQYITLAPDAPAIYDSNGNLNWQVHNGSATFTNPSNPLAYTVQSDEAITNNLNSNLNIGYKILPGLDLSGNFGYTTSQMNQSQTTPSTNSPPPYNTNPYSRGINFATSNISTWIIEPQLTYNKKIKKGMLDALIGTTFQGTEANSIATGAAGFSSDALLTDPASATNFALQGYQASLYRYEAIYGRIGYTWNDKYLVNITGRRDGSSRFGPGKQFGYFGAIGTGWIFSKEKFVTDNLPWLSFGKLRASYGTTGNDQIGDYQFLSTYMPVSTTYQGISGLNPAGLTNPDFRWETVKKLEGGIELDFLQNRINTTISYYRDRTSDQLVGYPLPLITGFSSVEANLPAVIQNTGLEITLNTANIKTKDFSWSTNINFTAPENKLVSYPGIQNSAYAYTYTVGQSLFIDKLVYHSTGVNPQTGQYTFATSNSNGIPSFPQDLMADPPAITQKYFGGFQNSFRYKGFQLDVLFQFVKQYGFNYLKNFYDADGLFNFNVPTYDRSRWQKPGDITSIGKFSTVGGADPNFLLGNSNAILGDNSYIRLKNLALSYQLPLNWQKAVQLKSARIYLQAQNLLTLTKYQGLDPETGGLTLPPLRMITVGIEASL